MNSDGKLPKICISRWWVCMVFLKRSKAICVVAKASGSQARIFVAALLGQGRAHAAGHGPGRMNFFAAENFNDFLAELAQADAGAGEIGVRGDQAENVALRLAACPSRAENPARSNGRSSARGFG